MHQESAGQKLNRLIQFVLPTSCAMAAIMFILVSSYVYDNECKRWGKYGVETVDLQEQEMDYNEFAIGKWQSLSTTMTCSANPMNARKNKLVDGDSPSSNDFNSILSVKEEF